MSKFINMMKVKNNTKMKKLLFKCGIRTLHVTLKFPFPILLFTQFEKEKTRKFYINSIKHTFVLWKKKSVIKTLILSHTKKVFPVEKQRYL